MYNDYNHEDILMNPHLIFVGNGCAARLMKAMQQPAAVPAGAPLSREKMQHLDRPAQILRTDIDMKQTKLSMLFIDADLIDDKCIEICRQLSCIPYTHQGVRVLFERLVLIFPLGPFTSPESKPATQLLHTAITLPYEDEDEAIAVLPDRIRALLYAMRHPDEGLYAEDMRENLAHPHNFIWHARLTGEHKEKTFEQLVQKTEWFHKAKGHNAGLFFEIYGDFDDPAVFPIKDLLSGCVGRDDNVYYGLNSQSENADELLVVVTISYCD